MGAREVLEGGSGGNVNFDRWVDVNDMGFALKKYCAANFGGSTNDVRMNMDRKHIACHAPF
jgi:hypothetical protein